MSYASIYSSLNENILQFLKSTNTVEVGREIIDLNENQYTYVEKPLHKYHIHASPSLVIGAIFHLKKSTVSKLENFLMHIGCIFCHGSNNAEHLANYNKTQNTMSIIFGKNQNDREIVGLFLHKYNVSLRLDKDGIRITGSGRSGIETYHALSDNFDTDFITAINDIESQIYDLTGFVVNQDFADSVKNLSIADVINKALSNRYITDVRYFDKNDFLELVKKSGSLSSFEVSTNSIIFLQDDSKLLLDSLNHIFTGITFDVLSKIITIVTNYKKFEGKLENIDVIFPVESKFYNHAKEPFVKIELSERYRIEFSTDFIRFYINGVLHQVKEYKGFSDIFDTILVESSRRVSVDNLQESLI